MPHIKTSLAASLCSLAFLAGCSSIQNNRQAEMIKISRNLVAPTNFVLEEAVGSNKLLIDFPDKIPGAESIDKYLIPDSKYFMVHIRQYHLVDNSSEKLLQKIKITQDSIYSILMYLAINYGIDKVYDEGETPEYAPYKNLCAKLNYFYTNSEGPAYLDLEKLREQNIAVYKGYLFFEEQKAYDGVYMAASESKLEILGAESVETIEQASSMWERVKGMGFFRWFTEKTRVMNAICENREYKFLEIASAQDSPRIFAVYGAKHAWGGKASCGRPYRSKGRDSICDNIAKWNSANPDKKFFLIEITPFSR